MQSNSMSIWKALIILTLIVAISIGGLWVLNQFVESELALGLIGGTVAIITASINYRAAKEKEIESRLFSEKQKVYSDLVETIMGLFHGGKSDQPLADNSELVEKLRKIRTSLVIWGSIETIKSFDAMGEAGLATQDSGNPAEGLRWLGTLMEHVRRDLGHKDPKGSGLEIMIGMLIPEDRPKIRALLESSTSNKT